VTFVDGSAVLGSVAVDSTGKARFSTAALGAGSHAITGFYSGDANIATCTGKMTQTIARVTLTAAVSSSINSPFFGQMVTFTAKVTAKVPGSAAPMGTVVFLDGKNILGAATLDSTGTATLSTAALGAGNHTIVVSYTASKNFAAVTGKLTQIVKAAVTNLTLSSSASSSVFGQTVTFTATVNSVAPGAGIPQGKLTFLEGKTVLFSGLLDSTGAASFATSKLAVGNHLITVSYLGVPNFAASGGK
jgi:hypothetical protein